VRIPYQQKRMFGFVTFVYPETVKLILAKGNPHFVCDARVLVKPYKEKGKVPDKYRHFLFIVFYNSKLFHVCFETVLRFCLHLQKASTNGKRRFFSLWYTYWT
jgi:hypothetical protein